MKSILGLWWSGGLFLASNGYIDSGPDKTVENQVGASGWFVRLNLFARSQNPPFGGLAVWPFGRLAVIEYIGRICYARFKGVLLAIRCQVSGPASLWL